MGIKADFPSVKVDIKVVSQAGKSYELLMDLGGYSNSYPRFRERCCFGSRGPCFRQLYVPQLDPHQFQRQRSPLFLYREERRQKWQRCVHSVSGRKCHSPGLRNNTDRCDRTKTFINRCKLTRWEAASPLLKDVLFPIGGGELGCPSGHRVL